jgi:1-deoxy-D-xylulose-5-phosphate reductoisomerase
MALKNIVILGSTGSIGINTLKVVEQFPQNFRVIGLTAYNNYRLLKDQIQKFSPEYVAINENRIAHLKGEIDTSHTKVLDAATDLPHLVARKEVDIVVIAMRGSAALEPFLAAVQEGKIVAPANKEALVIAGDLIMRTAKRQKASIIPIDSEQSAIFQCLEGGNRRYLKKVILTASGGALWHVPEKEFDQLSVETILDHPRWKMGKKITVDSATLMNKGFEVIEAARLFDLTVEQIEVLVHPQAIIHSMVELRDGSVLAQLGVTDMRLPIQYALTYPHRWESPLNSLDFLKEGSFTFAEPDLNKFPSLGLAFDVLRQGGSTPCVLNAADEEAVQAFLGGQISFTDIYKIVEKVVRNHKQIQEPELQDVLKVDAWSREETRKYLTQASV